MCCGRMKMKFRVQSEDPAMSTRSWFGLGWCKDTEFLWCSLQPWPRAHSRPDSCRNCWALEISYKGHWFQPFILAQFPYDGTYMVLPGAFFGALFSFSGINSQPEVWAHAQEHTKARNTYINYLQRMIKGSEWVLNVLICFNEQPWARAPIKCQCSFRCFIETSVPWSVLLTFRSRGNTWIIILFFSNIGAGVFHTCAPAWEGHCVTQV